MFEKANFSNREGTQTYLPFIVEKVRARAPQQQQ